MMEDENMEFVLIGLITILFIFLNTLQRNQERIESKLNRIIEQLGVSEPSIKSPKNS